MPRKKVGIREIEKVEKTLEDEKREKKKGIAHRKKTKKEKEGKKYKRYVLATARRKKSIARARVQKGKPIVRINKVKVEAIQNPYVREIINESLRLAGDYVKDLDISVNIKGGGAMGQAQAARSAIAKGIVKFTGDEGLKNLYLMEDRYLLVDDARRVEPKKFKGPKARARFQKSYR